MKLSKDSYTLDYDPLDQQVNFEGILRLNDEDEVNRVLDYLINVHNQVKGTLRLNFRRLRYINSLGLKSLSLFIAFARGRNQLHIKIIASGVLAWSERVLPNLCALWDDVDFSIYDRNFYKSQTLVEDVDFIPLLRNQTRILWPYEKEILQHHGLKRGMTVADICCGCGDVPLLICREFQPAYVLGVDHSEASVEYARNLQEEFNVQRAEFQLGDATALMLEDDRFDFVLCRLSLQIFSHPEQILKELIRITRPGGRIYTLCEDYDLITGFPGDDAIRQTYDLAAMYGDHMGMDLRSGKKLFSMLSQARLEEIVTDYIMVDTNTTDRNSFAKVINSWRTFSVDVIGTNLNLGAEEKDTLLAGYDCQLRAIQNPSGFSNWGMIAASGRKPIKL